MGFAPIIPQVMLFWIYLLTYDNTTNQMFTGLVWLDLTKVFDTVEHDILLQKLHHYDIRGMMNNCFFNLF